MYLCMYAWMFVCMYVYTYVNCSNHRPLVAASFIFMLAYIQFYVGSFMILFWPWLYGSLDVYCYYADEYNSCPPVQMIRWGRAPPFYEIWYLMDLNFLVKRLISPNFDTVLLISSWFMTVLTIIPMLLKHTAQLTFTRHVSLFYGRVKEKHIYYYNFVHVV